MTEPKPMDIERLTDIREAVQLRRDQPMPIDDHRDAIIAELLADRDYHEQRAEQAEGERDVLAAGLQILDETTYNATSEPFPKWVVVSMGDGAGYWIDAVSEDGSRGGTVESVYESDAIAWGRDAECEAARVAGTMNHAMALARALERSEQVHEPIPADLDPTHGVNSARQFASVLMRDVGAVSVEAMLASPHWRWMPGMRYWSDHRQGWERIPDRPDRASFAEWVLPTSTPDLDDAATLGCLLALVREAWVRPYISTKHHAVLGWIVKDGDDDFLKSVACDTEVEALVAALLAAPLPGVG